MAFLFYIHPMPRFGKPILKTIPVIRLLLPLMVGILLQYHLDIPLFPFYIVGAVGLLLFLFYQLLNTAKKFSFRWISGTAITILFIAVGGILSFVKNIEHNPQWIGKYYKENFPVMLTLQEPIVEKPKSFKALAKAKAVLIDGKWQPVNGDVLLYFRKDSTKPNLDYGSQIVLAKGLTPIINAGNPGGFNYARYCSFQNISYQAFLNDDAFISLQTTSKNWFDNALIQSRTKVLSILRENIKDPNQLSVAEALLIGYRDDLDRDLVQSYSNTGVVHIIAISGLHLGMIYGLLVFLFQPFRKYKWSRFVKPLTILFVLWAFTFIAGGASSIMRSAIMFSFIVVGESLKRKTTMYNSLALSAFVLLLINPFNLWDVGFQLSYTAVLSIVVFQQHINKWFYTKNKLLKGLWSLNSITLSAQILTLPIVLYHFHQFPTLFMFTNLFAVPFSGLILYAELLLLVTYFIPYVGAFVGKAIGWGVELMNSFIQRVDTLPFAVWPSLQINIPQAIILYASIIGFAFWLINKHAKSFMIGLGFFVAFIALRSIDFSQRNAQQKLVVYNVPNHTAIDIIEGRNYQFIGDSILTEDGFLRNFHIKPSRVLHRIIPTDSLMNISFEDHLISCNGKNILIVDDALQIPPSQEKIKLDAIVLTKNPRIYLSRLSTSFECSQYIFDSSNPFWKVAYWKKDADSLHLRHHSTATQGAFVMDL
jgi:competence protein ComEC